MIYYLQFVSIFIINLIIILQAKKTNDFAISSNFWFLQEKCKHPNKRVSYNQLAINYNRCAENKYFLMTSNKLYLLKIKYYTVPAYV